MKTMRYLLMALVLAVMLPVMGLAANGLSDIDSANTSLTIKLDFSGMAAPDSCVLKWHLIFGTTNPPKTRSDSVIVGINGTADTVKVSGLHNGTKYYYSANFWAQDTTTGTRPVHYYSIGIDSGITKTVGQTIAAATAATYRQFQIKDTYFGADSAFKRIQMQYRVKGATTWTTAAFGAVISNVAVGYDSTYLASVDTLNAVAAAPVDLLVSGVTYEVRVIATDSTGTDTSNTLEIAVPAIPNFTALYNVPQGKVSENLYHYTWSWNYANHTAYIADINLFGIKTLEVQGKIFGLDNNHRAATPDSFSLYVYSDKYSDGSGAIKVDTLVIKGLDTTSFSKDYSLMHESKASAGDTVFANLVGSRLWLWFASKDSMNDYGTMGDTSWMDTHYGDMWIILNK